MRQEIEKLHDKVDKIDERLDNIDVHLAIYNEQLKIRIKRTDLLEKDVKPIKEHVTEVRGMLKILGVAAAIAGIVSAIKLFI